MSIAGNNHQAAPTTFHRNLHARVAIEKVHAIDGTSYIYTKCDESDDDICVQFYYMTCMTMTVAFADRLSRQRGWMGDAEGPNCKTSASDTAQLADATKHRYS